LNCFIVPDPTESPGSTIGAVCRVLAYLGEPLPVRNLLFDPDNGLVAQSYSPQMMNTFLNLGGFGMQAWDPSSLRPDDPFTYRTTTLPSFDRNLRFLAAKVAPTCLVAHVRGVTYTEEAVVADTNLHPFRFPGARLVLAHNGHLRQFTRMRYSLVGHVRPELAERIEGTTDSEWIYALILSQLDDPYGLPETRELAEATAASLRILRQVRAAHGIDTSSPVNLCPQHRPVSRLHAVLVRLRLVSTRRRVPRDGPSVRQPLVRGRRGVRRA
jgi:glutamine amidotransferase